jgi:hypothetical protein
MSFQGFTAMPNGSVKVVLIGPKAVKELLRLYYQFWSGCLCAELVGRWLDGHCLNRFESGNCVITI